MLNISLDFTSHFYVKLKQFRFKAQGSEFFYRLTRNLTQAQERGRDSNRLVILIIFKFKLSIKSFAPIAQLNRALASGAKGCRFESCWGHLFYVEYLILKNA